LRVVAGKISGIVGTVPALQDPSRSAMVMKEPYGVVLGIAPGFFPSPSPSSSFQVSLVGMEIDRQETGMLPTSLASEL